MSQRISLLVCVVFAVVMVGCSTSEPANNAGTTTNANKAATTTTPATTTTAANTAVEKIGVPECDDFLAAYETCVSGKVPEVARAQYKAGIEQWRTSWRKLAENPQTKATLAAACKQSAEAARTSMKTYNCTF